MIGSNSLNSALLWQSWSTVKSNASSFQISDGNLIVREIHKVSRQVDFKCDSTDGAPFAWIVAAGRDHDCVIISKLITSCRMSYV